jgi:hypothetical protein
MMKKLGTIIAMILCSAWTLSQSGQKTRVEIPIDESQQSRDIQIQFSTEADSEAEQWAIIHFESDGEIRSAEIRAWDPASADGGSIDRELHFKDVDGDIDRIVMTLSLQNIGGVEPDGTIHVSNVLLLDPPHKGYFQKGADLVAQQD